MSDIASDDRRATVCLVAPDRPLTVVIVSAIIMAPFIILAATACTVVLVPLLGLISLAWTLYALLRVMIRPALYVLGLTAILAAGAAGGYLYAVYQASAPQRVADALPALPEPPPITASPALPSQPTAQPVPAPRAADPFGLRQ